LFSFVLSKSKLDSFSSIFSQHLFPGDIVLLYGDMGAGKTTFTRSLASHFGIENVNSPTFSLANKYEGDLKINHIDLYRLNNETDFYSFDLDRYLNDKESVTLIEWSEKLGSFMPEQYWKVELDYVDDDKRKVTINRIANDDRAEALEIGLSDFNISS
jgi:tRNA threonylcarbamoyladenosine biosynthesis protein TsaE